MVRYWAAAKAAAGRAEDEVARCDGRGRPGRGAALHAESPRYRPGAVGLLVPARRSAPRRPGPRRRWRLTTATSSRCSRPSPAAERRRLAWRRARQCRSPRRGARGRDPGRVAWRRANGHFRGAPRHGAEPPRRRPERLDHQCRPRGRAGRPGHAGAVLECLLRTVPRDPAGARRGRRDGAGGRARRDRRRAPPRAGPPAQRAADADDLRRSMPAGAIVTRASGQPRKVDVIAALGRTRIMRQPSIIWYNGFSAALSFPYPERVQSTYLTKRRAVDNCHTATALCRMP